jgi:predicted enzyme related to lactoylglutathione lyase
LVAWEGHGFSRAVSRKKDRLQPLGFAPRTFAPRPLTDIPRSADFYHQVFHWTIRKRGDGSTAFDDTTGQVSGAFVLGRPPAAKPGLLFYIMCDSVPATLDAILAHQGEIVQPIGADAPEITARFRDPAGNVIGLYQQPG